MIYVNGIILLERTEIVIRIFEVNKNDWKLIHYQNLPLKQRSALAETLDKEISSLLADFFTTDNARYVTQWKTGARGLAPRTINAISSSLGLEIDNISLLREQELLCKGLFTELW